jgi:hypothetical protein
MWINCCEILQKETEEDTKKVDQKKTEKKTFTNKKHDTHNKMNKITLLGSKLNRHNNSETQRNKLE